MATPPHTDGPAEAASPRREQPGREPAPVRALADGARVTHLHDRYPVGPLGRAVAQAGGAARTIEPGGTGSVLVTPLRTGGEPEVDRSRPVHREVDLAASRRWWRVAVGLAAAAAVASWIVPLGGGSSSDGAGRPHSAHAASHADAATPTESTSGPDAAPVRADAEHAARSRPAPRAGAPAARGAARAPAGSRVRAAAAHVATPGSVDHGGSSAPAGAATAPAPGATSPSRSSGSGGRSGAPVGRSTPRSTGPRRSAPTVVDLVPVA